MPKLFDLIKTSLYIGFTGYGGPAILAHMKSIFVKKKGWVTEKDFMDGLSLAQLLPGATGVTLMGYLGFRLKRFRGADTLPFLDQVSIRRFSGRLPVSFPQTLPLH